MKHFLFVFFALMAVSGPAGAQLNQAPATNGFYTSSGDCLLTDGSITLRSAKHQMIFHYDLAGNLMMADVMAQLGGPSPIGGQIWGGKTYYSTTAGMVLDPASAVYAIESTGRQAGTALGYYFDRNTNSWLLFDEVLCRRDRAALLASALVDFKDNLAARFEIDLLTEFDAVKNTYARAILAFQ